MPESNDPELTLVPSDDVSGTPIAPGENEAASAVEGGSPIEGVTRLGPGNIEGLRFKWTVRRVPEGYVVDETIGASTSAFSSAPMSRDNTLAFLDAREAEARQRFESLRRKFLEVQKLATGERNLQNVNVQTSDVQNHDAEKDSQSTENLQPDVIVAALSPDKETKSPPLAGGINVDDVMDRIVRLLDEH